MADNTLERIVRDAANLPLDQQQQLIQMLLARLSGPSPKRSIAQIAAEQGKAPLSFSEIRELGSFFWKIRMLTIWFEPCGVCGRINPEELAQTWATIRGEVMRSGHQIDTADC